MKIEPVRYTSGRMALAELCSSISRLERRRRDVSCLEDLVTLTERLLLRGDLLGCVADHELARTAADQAGAAFPTAAAALVIRGRIAARFHRFKESHALLDRAMIAGGPPRPILSERASLFQATGKFWEALALRDRLAREHPDIETLGALATLSVEMGQFAMAELLYAEALKADDGESPFPCAQVLYDWGAGALRNGDFDRAEEILVQLEAVLPWHIPGRARRAEIALARGQFDLASELIQSSIDASDAPAFRVIHARILAARGDYAAAAMESLRAASVRASRKSDRVPTVC